MVQQVSNGMGVAVAAVTLHLMQDLRGEASSVVSVKDIQITFVVMSLVALSACFFYARLEPDAGAEVSGHGRPAVPAEDAAD